MSVTASSYRSQKEMESGTLGERGEEKVGLVDRKGEWLQRTEGEIECREVSEGCGHAWMSEEAESVFEVASERMDGIMQLYLWILGANTMKDN